MLESDSAPPFLKWAGGKRWLTFRYQHLFPIQYDRYIEPFLGSGAVFFHLKPNAALLSDANSHLVATYLQIRSNWKKVRDALRKHDRLHSKEHYYLERARKRTAAHEKAAQFIYLNRTCWNGLYRVNLEGIFNVPIGTKNTVCLDTDNFEAVAETLSRAELVVSDFETVIQRASEGDFLFVDPPSASYLTRSHPRSHCWTLSAGMRRFSLIAMNFPPTISRRICENGQGNSTVNWALPPDRGANLFAYQTYSLGKP